MSLGICLVADHAALQETQAILSESGSLLTWKCVVGRYAWVTCPVLEVLY